MERSIRSLPLLSPHAARATRELDRAIEIGDHRSAASALQSGADPERVTVRSSDEGMRELIRFARKRNSLYPSKAAADSETALDFALRGGLDGDTRKRAEALLDSMGKDIRRLWQSATNENRLDVQRAILLLKADGDPFFRVLEQAPVTDKGIAKTMKGIPYFSPKRGLPRNLNGEARFSGSNDLVACRHLVQHRQAMQERQASSPKFDYGQFADERAIRRHVSPAVDGDYHEILAHAREAHLVYNRDLGMALVRQLAMMETQGEPDRWIVLTSVDHVMGVDLRIKNVNGKARYVATLFDPNTTTSHARAASESLRAFETLGLKYFLPKSLYEAYYRGGDDVTLMFVRPKVPREPIAPDSVPCAAGGRRLTSTLDAKDVRALVLWHFLAGGFAGSLRGLEKEIAGRSEKEQIDLLSAQPCSAKAPGLFMALQHGHADAVKAFGELVTRVPEEPRAELVAAKDADGTPGLFMALQNGHADAVKAFGELVARVPEKSRAELVAATTAAGSPGLYFALQNGHADAVKAFGELVKWVPEESRAELVAATTAAGSPGLYVALQNGHADAVKAFGELVTWVPEKSRAELVAAMTADGSPGLYVALQNGHAGAVKAFGELVMRVPEESRAELVAARAANGIPGLHSALLNGHADAIEAFDELVTRVPLEMRARLVAAKDVDGTPGLFLALQEGHADAVKAFGELVARLPEESRAELVAAKSTDGIPGLLIALQCDHADAVKAFGELVAQVPEESRAELVAAKSTDGIPGLFIALQNGCAEAVKAFGELVTRVPPETRAGLVAAKDADGTPGLFLALQEGHADAVKAFGELVARVPEESRAELVAAKDVDGTPGLWVALQNGHVDAAKAFVELLERFT